MKRYKFFLITAGTGIILIIFFNILEKIPDGEEIFRMEGCMGCHSFKGKGAGAGPELTGVTGRRSESWIKKQIQNPTSNNPDSRMPSYGHLSRKEINSIISFLKE